MVGHTGLFATSAECIAKAGNNYGSTIGTEDRINEYCLQIESYVNVVTGYNWSNAVGALNVDVKYILTEIESCFVGISLLNAKPTGEDGAMSRIEYEDRVNVLFARFIQCMDIMTNIGTQKFMTEA